MNGQLIRPGRHNVIGLVDRRAALLTFGMATGAATLALGNLMRNALNMQIWSFRHPDFLVVSSTYGVGHLALSNQSAWDKYRLAAPTDGSLEFNTLIQTSRLAAATATKIRKASTRPAGNSVRR